MPFHDAKVVLRVRSLIEVESFRDGLTKTLEIVVEGLLAIHEENLSKPGLPVWQLTNQSRMVFLANNCRRVSSFPWDSELQQVRTVMDLAGFWPRKLNDDEEEESDIESEDDDHDSSDGEETNYQLASY